MARNVAIKVSINGTDQAVKSLEDLEGAVEQLRNELKSVEVGSDQFKQLSGELQNAESQLKTLNKSFEGLEPQQKAEAFVKLGEGIAGSFAIATAALTAFGVESEEVEEAQLAVTQALTAAIGFRQIAEAGLQARIVATTISQKAYNLAATAGNAVTKAFYTTLAANPITAIVVAVAALAAGIYALVSAQEEQITAQEQMNDAMDEASKKTVQQELQLKSLQTIVNDVSASEETRNAALNQLKTLLPEIETLELDNEDAIKKVNTAINRQITLIQQRAKTEALSQLVVEKTKELLEIQNSDLEDNIGFWEKAGNYLLYGFNPIQAEVQNTVDAVTNKIEKQSEIQEEINKFSEEYQKLLEELLKLEEDNEEIIEENNKRKQRQTQIERSRTDAVKQQIKAIQNLGEALAFNYGEPKVLTDLRDLNNEIKEFTGEDEDFLERARRLFTTQGQGFGDVFGTFYDEQREALSSTITGDVADFQKAVNDTIREGAQLVQLGPEEGGITIEAFVTLQNLVSEYTNLRSLIEETPDITDVLDPENSSLNFFNSLKTQLISTGQIIFKEVDGRIELLDEEDRQVQDLVTAKENFIESEKELKRIIRERLEEQVKLGKLTKEEADELAEARAQAVINLSQTITVQEEQIRGVLFETQKVQEEIAENQTEILSTGNEAYRNYVLQNLDALVEYNEEVIKNDEDLFDGLALSREERRLQDKAILALGLEDYRDYIEQRKIDANDLAAFELFLAQQNIFLEDLTAEERIKILEAFYKKKKELMDEDAEETQSGIAEGVEGIAEGLQQVAQVAQTGVQVFQQYVQTQLTLLQEEESRILSQIVGDSEEAEQKRLEIQEEYEQRRKEVTKRGQLAQLELTRLQAVANVAEAVAKALTAGPVLGQVLAGVSAAIGAIQVGIITTQIAQVRNLARGGLLVGNTHENGGIPLAGGGVVAEGGEAVINRRASIDYRGLLNEVSMSSGGAPLINSSFDDTRLIEAINRQNRNPIKAYVLEKDITKSQGINKRLQQLSKI